VYAGQRLVATSQGVESLYREWPFRVVPVVSINVVL